MTKLCRNAPPYNRQSLSYFAFLHQFIHTFWRRVGGNHRVGIGNAVVLAFRAAQFFSELTELLFLCFIFKLQRRWSPALSRRSSASARPIKPHCAASLPYFSTVAISSSQTRDWIARMAIANAVAVNKERFWRAIDTEIQPNMPSPSNRLSA